ncbi:DUF554 domain-containing protein [Desulfuromonas sp. AOP6]|uniref:DUF554 domain-containing protein n=1 Tax=Desulfuromonas sp. AOP6 TaxID=1566351 RepID=UPI0012822F90|nr:DUF554 domain-containing protein [Desulfuromonas sp. AOP6]BCA79787.1 membrane protein [Desulfuromonas sp. AOP6]
MLLKGTLVNIAAVICGCAIGRSIGHLLSDRMRNTLMCALGLAVLLIGLQLALQSQHPLIPIGSLILGGLAGELARLEHRLEVFGQHLQSRFSGSGKIAEGFVTASLLYCVGAMAIMGAIQEGFGEKPSILYAKAALDGIASIALTSTLGVGVVFSIIPLFLYQGGLTLLAGLAKTVLTTSVMTEMNSVGGLLIMAISFDLLGIRRLPVGNMLPSIFMAIALMWSFGLA